MASSSLYSSEKSPVVSPSKVKNEDNKKVQMCVERKGQKCSSVDIVSSAQLRAEIFQASLPSRFPSFVKCMLPSHVARGFSLIFSSNFCDLHLPKDDATVVLVDENNEEFATKFLAYKNGLSGGWRGFSIAHNLVENDVLVFQLIKQCKFKVYIFRENCSTIIDGAVIVMDFLDGVTKNGEGISHSLSRVNSRA